MLIENRFRISLLQLQQKQNDIFHQLGSCAKGKVWGFLVKPKRLLYNLFDFPLTVDPERRQEL